MQARHFEAIARAMRAQLTEVRNSDGISPAQMEMVAFSLREASIKLANELAQFNPRFDQARFLAACGVEG